jgi:DNA-binding LacI/PurR family transcriptional regulator
MPSGSGRSSKGAETARAATPATIRDVAALAGVSVAAVSRFVNGKQRFSPDAEARITSAIAQVGYRSNPLARSMSTGCSGAVAVLVAGVEGATTAALIKGINRAALRMGCDLLIIDASPANAPADGGAQLQRDIDRALDLQVDGLLLAAPTLPGTAEQLVRSGRPFVDLVRERGQHAVFEQAGALLGHYLGRSGHRRVAYLACAQEPGSAFVELGLRRALAETQAALDVHQLADAHAEAGTQIASALLLRARQHMPHAIVACNDAIAMGLLGEAPRLAVPVPQAVSVAGVGNTAIGRHLWPALTTVELHHEARGERALMTLLKMIGRPPLPAAPPALPEPGDGADDTGASLAPRLIVRESTQPR